MSRREEVMKENNIESTEKEDNDDDESDSDSDESDSESESGELCESDLEDNTEHFGTDNFEQGIYRLCGKVAYQMRNEDASLRSDSEVSKTSQTKHVDHIYSGY